MNISERRRALRAEMRHALTGLGQFGRSSAFEWDRAIPIAMALHEANLIDMNRNYVDQRSGRRVRTILREMGRVTSGEKWPAGEIVELYEYLRDKPLPEVKARVRAIAALATPPPAT